MGLAWEQYLMGIIFGDRLTRGAIFKNTGVTFSQCPI